MIDCEHLFAKVIEEYRAEGYPHEVIGQWSLPANDVRDLLEAVHRHQPRNILEVGTFVGLSTMLIVLASRTDAQITSVDPNFPLEVEMGSMGSSLGESDGRKTTHDIARAVARRLGIDSRIELAAGGFSSEATFASRRANPELTIPIVGPDLCAARGPFDMVFVDGLHYADVVEADLELASRHLAPGGIVLVHDCIGMWGTNVRCGILRFLARNPGWQFLHHPFRSLYRSVGTVFRPPEHPELALELLQRPSISGQFAKVLQPLASSLTQRLQPDHVIELACGQALLAPHFADFTTIDVAQATDDLASQLEALVCAAARRGLQPARILVAAAGALDILDDSSLARVLDVVSRAGVIGAFLLTPPGERGATCRYSRPLRRWVRMAAESEAEIRIGCSFDLAPSNFHFIRGGEESKISTALSNLVLVTTKRSYCEDQRLRGYPVVCEYQAEAYEQQESLSLHYGAAIQRMFLDLDGAARTNQQLREQLEIQQTGVADRDTEKIISDQIEVIEWQKRLIQNKVEHDLPKWRKLVLSSRTFMLTILDNNPSLVVADALVHALRHDHPNPCLMLSWTPTGDEIDRFLRDPRISAIGIKDSHETVLAPAHATDPRVGRYFHDGQWILPKDVQTVYFLGPWRLMKRAMIADAWQAGVRMLYTRVGAYWFRVPTESLYRFHLRTLRARDIVTAAKSNFANGLKRSGIRRLLPQRFRRRIMTLEKGFELALAGALPRQDFVSGRIVLVTGNLSPGGAERQVKNTLIGLKRHGFEDVHFLAHHLQPGRHHMDFHLASVRAAGIPAREIERISTSLSDRNFPTTLRQAAAPLPANLVFDIANLVREFDNLKPEVVHAWLDWDNIRAGIAAAISGVPRILLSGRNLAPYNFNLYQSYMDPGYRTLAKLPNIEFLNNSRAGADDYADWIGIPRERIRVIHNGLDFGDTCRLSAEERSRKRRAIGVGDDDLLVGGVFRFEDEKRPLLWLDCASEIAKALPNARFVLYGQGSMEEAIEARIRNIGLAERFTLAGVTNNPLQTMSLMDIFLLTSYGEGLPNVLIEAQSVGTPVVCTLVGGTSEAVDQGVTGTVVNSSEADDIAKAVIDFLQNGEARTRAATAGPQFVRTKFAVERMIERTIAAYGVEARQASSETDV